jgi:hypothetical protein
LSSSPERFAGSPERQARATLSILSDLRIKLKSLIVIAIIKSQRLGQKGLILGRELSQPCSLLLVIALLNDHDVFLMNPKDAQPRLEKQWVGSLAQAF